MLASEGEGLECDLSASCYWCSCILARVFNVPHRVLVLRYWTFLFCTLRTGDPAREEIMSGETN